MAEPKQKSVWDQFLDPDEAISQPRRPQLAPRPERKTEKRISEWDQFEDATPSPAEKIGAIERGATQGMAESGGVVAGAVTGGRLGSMAGQWGTAIGAIVGAGAGMMAGKSASALLGGEAPETMAPSLRPYGIAGQTAGAALPIASLPIYAASEGFRFVGTKIGGWLNQIIETAARHPAAFAISEDVGATWAGIAGGATEAYAPGETGKRLAVEVGVGFANPARIAVSAFSNISDAFAAHVMAKFNPGAMDSRAAAALQKIVREAKEDPVRLAELLRRPGIPGLPEQTSAQFTSSPAMLSLEAKLVKESARFGVEIEKRTQSTFDAIHQIMGTLRGAGDPESLMALAKIRQTHYRSLIAQRLEQATTQATLAARRITTDAPELRGVIAKQANDALENALSDIRAVERELWDRATETIGEVSLNIREPIGITGKEGLLETYQRLRNSISKYEDFPIIVEGFVKDISKEAPKGVIYGADGKPLLTFTTGPSGGETTVKQLLNFRRDMLAKARNTAPDPNRVLTASQYGQLAEGALDDIGRLADDLGPLTEARTFSRELNDAFTRTFSGDAIAPTRTGANRIPPELMFRRAIGGGMEGEELRMRQIEEAMKFLPSRGLGGTEAVQSLEFVMDSQRRIIRLAAAASIDPTTGRASATQLADFVFKHAEVLQKFPEIKTVLQDAIKSELKLKTLQDTLRGVPAYVQQKAAFARVAQFDSASDAVADALKASNPEPVTSFKKLALMAKTGGQDTLAGLRAAVWEDATRQASDVAGNISFKKFYERIFSPIRPSQPTLAVLLEQNGVMTGRDLKRAKDLLEEAIKIENIIGTKSALQKAIESPDALFDFVIRVAGSSVGTTAGKFIPGLGSGHQLQQASAGSTLAKSVFEKVPKAGIRSLLEQAMLDRNFAAMLLEKPASKIDEWRIAKQIHAYLLQMGMTEFNKPVNANE